MRAQLHPGEIAAYQSMSTGNGILELSIHVTKLGTHDDDVVLIFVRLKQTG